MGKQFTLTQTNKIQHNHVHITWNTFLLHYTDVIMGTIASQITSLTIVYSTVYSDADQRKYQSSASLAFVRGIHRRPVNSPHKWPVTRKMFPFDDVIMLHPSRLQPRSVVPILVSPIPDSVASSWTCLGFSGGGFESRCAGWDMPQEGVKKK